MSWELAMTLSVFAAVVVAWDVGRRWVDGSCFNQVALDRISELERERDRQREQLLAVLSKLNAAQAAQAQRLSRIGSPR